MDDAFEFFFQLGGGEIRGVFFALRDISVRYFFFDPLDRKLPPLAGRGVVPPPQVRDLFLFVEALYFYSILSPHLLHTLRQSRYLLSLPLSLRLPVPPHHSFNCFVRSPPPSASVPGLGFRRALLLPFPPPSPSPSASPHTPPPSPSPSFSSSASASGPWGSTFLHRSSGPS